MNPNGNKTMRRSLTVLTMLLGVLQLSAQEKQPELKLSSAEEMRRFEPPANEEYTLGSGDQVSVTVANRPEITATRVIGPDGRISIPLIGEVEIAGETRGEATAKIRQALSVLYPSSIVTVGVDKYGSNKILLLGNVEHPGVMYFDGTPTLLEVITRGGSTMSADSSANKTTRAAVPETVRDLPRRSTGPPGSISARS